MNKMTLLEVFKDCKLEDEKVIAKSEITTLIKAAKELYGFDVLKYIIAKKISCNEIELKYNLYSTDEKEECFIATIIKDSAESISVIYNNAADFEKNIGDKSGIKFY